MNENDGSLPLAVLDFVGIEYGEAASDALVGAVGIAQAIEAAGYRRYWVSEHHNMNSLACSAPELLTAYVGAQTSRIRVGAAGLRGPPRCPRTCSAGGCEPIPGRSSPGRSPSCWRSSATGSPRATPT